MPRVQYSNPPKNISVTLKMMAPKNYSDINAWLRAARKRFTKQGGEEVIPNWPHYVRAITGSTIVFELINSATHERCAVVIDRTPD